jgi:hypothetical protein
MAQSSATTSVATTAPTHTTTEAEKMGAVISYLRTMKDVPYKWWDGNTWKPDNTAPFWMPDYMALDDGERRSLPPPPTAEEVSANGGTNCAGLINLALQYFGIEPPGIHTEYPGGTGAWGAYVVWIKYNPARVYPRGSILFRSYRNEKDQGHMAMITTDDNSIGLNNHLIHASAVDGRVTEVPIRVVHTSTRDYSGYFECVGIPSFWLTHSWYGYCRPQRVLAGYRLP